MASGKFVISLDFELFWGVRDSRTISGYGDRILAVQDVIPRLLQSFDRHEIRATFSTVGFLFFENKNDLLHNLPSRLPSYENKTLSPYAGHFDLVGENEAVDKYHFGASLIRLIQEYPEQEIGTHTFSHYYCLERGQTAAEFQADLEKAIEIASRYGIRPTSLVFPRNQFNAEYLDVCEKTGIICFRGNEHSWIYHTQNGDTRNRLKRALKLLDTYLNISGFHCYTDEYLKSNTPVDIPSSRFLRPYSSKLKLLEKRRLKRITNAMTHAAKNNLTYHLWWHPHNFGADQEENFAFLEKILLHYTFLKQTYGFQSCTMSELALKLSHGK